MRKSKRNTAKIVNFIGRSEITKIIVAYLESQQIKLLVNALIQEPNNKAEKNEMQNQASQHTISLYDMAVPTLLSRQSARLPCGA
jgi:hypothetical protein